LFRQLTKKLPHSSNGNMRGRVKLQSDIRESTFNAWIGWDSSWETGDFEKKWLINCLGVKIQSELMIIVLLVHMNCLIDNNSMRAGP